MFVTFKWPLKSKFNKVIKWEGEELTMGNFYTFVNFIFLMGNYGQMLAVSP